MLRPILLLPVVVAMLAGCLRNDGVVDPDDTRNKTVLAHFQGVAVRAADSDFDSDRLLDFPNPRIALVWEFFGSKVQGSAFGNTEVSVTSPIRFSIDMTGPPPPEIANSTEPVLGHFWLYSDRNGNGSFDRVQHPNVVNQLSAVDAIRDYWIKTEKEFAEVARLLPEPRYYEDTFFVDKDGTFLHPRNGKLDTLYKGTGARDTVLFHQVMYRRHSILGNYNSWEVFFLLRKRVHFHSWDLEPHEKYAYRYVHRDWKRVEAIPGKEDEFELRLQRNSMAYLNRFALLVAVMDEAAAKKWDDWPYNVDTVPGYDAKEDWLAGRGRWYHVAYFPDKVSLDAAILAEQGRSSFQVKNRDKLHRGYNILHCDDQYRCEVLGPDDDIIVDLGQSEKYFDPPSAPLVYPVKDYTPMSLGDAAQLRFEGSYSYIAYSEEDAQVTVAAAGGSLWAEVPRVGLLRLVAVDSLLFYAPGRDVQVEFVLDPEGKAYKLLLYHKQTRSACVRQVSPSAARAEGVRARAKQVAGRARTPFPDSVLSELAAQGFLRGLDTLTVSAAEGSDTLTVRHAGAVPQAYLASPDGGAYGLNSGDRFSILRNEKGTVTGLLLEDMFGPRVLPSLKYAPRPSAELFPAPAAPESLVSQDGGSGTDSYVGTGGRKRYGCAADGTYLKAGDGWVQEMAKGGTADAVSLRSGGDGLTLRLAGLAGRRARVVLRACREKGAVEDGRRFMISARGFRDGGEGGPGDLLQDDRFVEVSAAGDSLSFGPFPVPTDAYDVRLRRAPTLDSTFYFALDGYKVYAE